MQSSKATTIAISGIQGSFSEEAAQTFARDHKFTPKLIYATTAKHTFELVTNGEAKYGLVPLENSNGGIVYETIHAMSHYTFEIKSIFEIDVQHNLATLSATSADEITQIVSHQQALAQCRFYLRKRWHGVKLLEYEDTALAAKDLAEGKLSETTAVIVSKRAVELNDLRIIEPSVQDLKFNFTAFLAFTRTE